MDSQSKQEVAKSDRGRFRSIKVVLSGEAKDFYVKIKKLIEEECAKEITSSKNQSLFRSIKQKIDVLKSDPELGVHIAKNKIPKEYVLTYEVTNLWKINLSQGWRMIYTLKGSTVEIIALVFDILPHKDYDNKFGYKKR